jgi:hypothetical protein
MKIDVCIRVRIDGPFCHCVQAQSMAGTSLNKWLIFTDTAKSMIPFWLTPTKHERIRSLMQQRGIPETDYTVLSAAPRDVSAYLSASDAGLAFIKPCFSKIASSPTKYAEYLACGLPLIINAGIGDSDSLLEDNVGTLVSDFSEAQLENAAVK